MCPCLLTLECTTEASKGQHFLQNSELPPPLLAVKSNDLFVSVCHSNRVPRKSASVSSLASSSLNVLTITKVKQHFSSLGPNPAPWLPAAAFPIAGLSRKDSTCVPQLIQQGKWGWRRGRPDAAGAKAMQGLLPQLRRESFPSAPEAALPEDWLQTDPSHWGPAPSAAGTGPSLPASPAPTRDAPSQRAPKGRGVLALRSGRSDGRRAADPPREPQLALGAGGLRGGQWGCRGEAKPRDQILPRAAGVSSSILRPSL